MFKIELSSNKKHYIVTLFGIKLKFKTSNKPENIAEPISLPEITHTQNKMVDVSIVAIYKNEPDIIEWIEYHRLIGVDRFYLYDNESNDNSKALLQKYIDDGIVIYHYLKGRCKQMPAYKDAIFNYKNETKWMAIIDLDEYIVPIKNASIKEFLKEYENYPAVGISWQEFDNNNHIKRPEGLIIESYTNTNWDKDNPQPCCIKSIVNPRKVKSIYNPHFCLFEKEEVAVDENFEKIGKYNDENYLRNACVKIGSKNKIQINHYHTKSLEDYQRKLTIGFADSNKKRPIVTEESISFKTKIKDETILKYLPQLKERLGYK